jgi:hypothetical protein
MSPLDSQEEIRQVHEPRDAAEEEVGEGGQRRRGYDGTLQAGAARPVPGQVCTVPYSGCGIRLLTSKVPVPHIESLAVNALKNIGTFRGHTIVISLRAYSTVVTVYRCRGERGGEVSVTSGSKSDKGAAKVVTR